MKKVSEKVSVNNKEALGNKSISLGQLNKLKKQEMVLNLLNSKTNVIDIMKTAKVSIYTIRNICKTHSIPYPKIKKEDTVYKAIANIKNGVHDQVTLAELGITRQRLNQIKLKAQDYGVLV